LNFRSRLPVSLIVGDRDSQYLLKHPCGWRCPRLVKTLLLKDEE
jgi:hypothetical protein